MTERLTKNIRHQGEIKYINKKRLHPRNKVNGEIKTELLVPKSVFIYRGCDSYTASDILHFEGLIPEGERRDVAIAKNDQDMPVQAVVIDIDSNRYNNDEKYRKDLRERIGSEIFGIRQNLAEELFQAPVSEEALSKR